MLPLGVQPVLGNLVMFFQPTVQSPLVGPKTILYGMVFSHCSKGGIQESQKLVTTEPWTEGISQASTSYTVLNSWVKLFTGVKALGSTVIQEGHAGPVCGQKGSSRQSRALVCPQGPLYSSSEMPCFFLCHQYQPNNYRDQLFPELT